MMGRRAHGDAQQSEIGLIGTSGLLVTYLLNWRAERYEGECKQAFGGGLLAASSACRPVFCRHFLFPQNILLMR